MTGKDRLAGKIALIAGGANGIGRATARLFAAAGAPVVVADIDEAAGAATAAEIRAGGGQAKFQPTDVTRAEELKAAVDRAVTEFGGLDTVVLSVFVDIRERIVDLPEQAWDRVLNIGLKSGYLLAKAAIPAMLEAGGGSFVFISSVQATFGYAKEAAYTSAKAGLCGLTRQIAADYGPEGIRANCVLPGLVITDRNRRLWEDRPKLLARQKSCFPLRRVAEPEDVARVILFLSSDEAAFVTGVSLPVDGGLSIQSATAALFQEMING